MQVGPDSDCSDLLPPEESVFYLEASDWTTRALSTHASPWSSCTIKCIAGMIWKRILIEWEVVKSTSRTSIDLIE